MHLSVSCTVFTNIFSGDGREKKNYANCWYLRSCFFPLSPLELMRYLFTQTIEVVHIQLTVVPSLNGICHICFRSICVACNQNFTQSLSASLSLSIASSLFFSFYLSLFLSMCAYLSVPRCVKCDHQDHVKNIINFTMPKHALKLKSLFKWFAMQISDLTCI